METIYVPCVKSARIRSYSGPYFLAMRLNAESISPYSVLMWEDTDQNNSEYGHFSSSGCLTHDLAISHTTSNNIQIQQVR